MKRSGGDYVLLDITHRPSSFVREHFPTIHAECLRFGIDITSEPIPVVPAAHYMCGGITTDMSRTHDDPRAVRHRRVRFHGPARGQSPRVELAARGAGASATAPPSASRGRSPSCARARSPTCPSGKRGTRRPSDEAVVVTHNWDELRRTMWNYVGIVRSNTRLRRAARRVALLQEEIQRVLLEAPRHARPARAAQHRDGGRARRRLRGGPRHESRGLHTTIDYPDTRPELAVDTVIKRGVPAYLRGR
jgi:L-aspartate oxidase